VNFEITLFQGEISAPGKIKNIVFHSVRGNRFGGCSFFIAVLVPMGRNSKARGLFLTETGFITDSRL
jgi:hypothetical protein